VTDWLDWPFFEPRHRELAERLEDWCRATIHDAHASDPDAACRALVA
jgi:acyl-CoA dehydrogenase